MDQKLRGIYLFSLGLVFVSLQYLNPLYCKRLLTLKANFENGGKSVDIDIRLLTSFGDES